jgi:glutathione synthase/RimK-type ligase-like ATP-grasp enzyme
LKDIILIISHQNDIHVEAVANKLIAEKEKVLLLTLNDIGATGININLDKDKSNVYLKLESSQEIVNLSDVKSLWLRRTRMPDNICTQIKDISSREFSVNEYEYVLRGLYATTKAFVVSDYYAMRKADNILFQYSIAREIGLEIPSTIITNDPGEALEFAESFDKVCCKPMTDIINLKGGNYFGYTKVIPKEAIKKFCKSIKLAPTLIQEYIPKKFDLRITVVGKNVFACAIHSQETPETSEDWRQYYKNAPHTPFCLPDYISEKLIFLTQRLGLVFGAIDMILTPDERFVFIEDNPNGQWYWIQEMAGLNIAESIAKMLKRASV